MKRILSIIAVVILQTSVFVVDTAAQPSKTRVNTGSTTATTTTSRTSRTTAAATASRADLMFPTSVSMSDEVMWRRDIYRQLDLMSDDNAALYYPQKPNGNEMNLFAVMFRLFSTGKLPVYEPTQSGVEDFSDANRMHFKDFLTKWSIPYEMEGNRYKIEDIDIPSDEVKGFFVKECSYYDQNTATYNKRITALCPLLYRSDDYFSMDERQWPLFWVKMDDIEPYLSQYMVMTSNVNNAARMSIADYFATNRYKGKIFMTNNMQGKSLQQQVAQRDVAATDTLNMVDPTTARQLKLLNTEQLRIEKEMSDFEEHIWTTPVDSAELAARDSIAAANTKGKKASKRSSSGSSSASSSRSSRRSESATKTKKERSSSSSSSSGPRVSVRRQRH